MIGTVRVLDAIPRPGRRRGGSQLSARATNVTENKAEPLSKVEKT